MKKFAFFQIKLQAFAIEIYTDSIIFIKYFLNIFHV